MLYRCDEMTYRHLCHCENLGSKANYDFHIKLKNSTSYKSIFGNDKKMPGASYYP